MRILTDTNDLTDIDETMTYLAIRRGILLSTAPESPAPDGPTPAAPPSTGADPHPPTPTPPDEGELRLAVRETLEGYGNVRLPIVRAIAEASPDLLPKAEAYALAEAARPGKQKAQVMGGLRSSLERGWRTRTNQAYGPFITTHGKGFRMRVDLARVVLEVLDELGR